MKHYTIIADCGSTKTDWIVADIFGKIFRMKTEGMNPAVQPLSYIEEKLNMLPLRMLELGITDKIKDCKDWTACIYFYGTGCNTEGSLIMKELLNKIFPNASIMEIGSDILGAARALFHSSEGIACILGTGSNSCLYDGRHICANIPALGFILGDEGSGAVLGKLFINAMYKNKLPEYIKNDFEKEMSCSLNDIINKVYKRPAPNRFLASLSPYINKHIDCEIIEKLVEQNFMDFFKSNIYPYHRNDLKIGIVGSMAEIYKKQLNNAALQTGIQIAKILKSPIDELFIYHQTKA